MSRASPIGSPIQPSQAGSSGVDRIEIARTQRPEPREQVAEMLADPDPQQAVEGREDGLDRPALGGGLGG